MTQFPIPSSPELSEIYLDELGVITFVSQIQRPVLYEESRRFFCRAYSFLIVTHNNNSKNTISSYFL